MVKTGYQGKRTANLDVTVADSGLSPIEQTFTESEVSPAKKEILLYRGWQKLVEKSEEVLQSLSRSSPQAVEFASKALVSLNHASQFAEHGNMKGATVSLQLSYNELLFARSQAAKSRELNGVLNNLESAWDDMLQFVNKGEEECLLSAKASLHESEVQLATGKHRLD